MKTAPYVRGLLDLGGGAYAFMQPDGGWGWSNAGFICDGEDSLLVDTLFDEPLTAGMLAALEDATGRRPEDISLLVNTHANGDHTHGNALLANADVIASQASAREMEDISPALLASFKEGGAAGALGEGGAYFAEIFAPFDFAGVRGRAPTRVFSGTLDLRVGDKPVRLIEVGPAHTSGDVIVHSHADRAVFTGDILFIEGTPIMWAGPVGNWLKACDMICALDVDVIVPGHGPLADRAAVRRVQDYLRYIDREARMRFEAGLSAEEAARDIALGDFDSWGDAERIAVNVATLYHEYSGLERPGVVDLFALMGRLRRDRPGRRAAP